MMSHGKRVVVDVVTTVVRKQTDDADYTHRQCWRVRKVRANDVKRRL